MTSLFGLSSAGWWSTAHVFSLAGIPIREGGLRSPRRSDHLGPVLHQSFLKLHPYHWSPVGSVCLILGVTGGMHPDINYGTLGYFAMLNVHLLHVLRMQTDDFLIFTFLSIAACTRWVDMFWEDPIRLLSLTFIYVGSLAMVVGDARRAFRRKANGYRFTFLACAILVALYHANVWENYRRTVYDVGIGKGIDFHVASTGMGCAMTLCLLTARYVFAILRSPEVNPMIIIRAPIVLRPVGVRDVVPASSAVTGSAPSSPTLSPGDWRFHLSHRPRFCRLWLLHEAKMTMTTRLIWKRVHLIGPGGSSRLFVWSRK